MLWPYEWKVTGSNLGRQEFTFLLPTFTWSECEKVGVNLAQGGSQKGAEKPLNNYP